MLRENPELLGIYVRGSDIEKLMRQITCGDVGIEGAVVLPNSLFALVIERLLVHKSSSAYKTEWMSGWGARRESLGFLARRCSKKFLEAYLVADRELIESIVKPMLYLEFSVEVDLAICLYKHGFLSEDARGILVETVCEYARTGEDASVLSDPRLRSLLNDKELNRLREAIRTEVLPHIEEVRLEHQSNRAPDDDPEWHMRRFTQLLDTIGEAYPQSRRIRNIIKRERLQVQEWINENSTEEDSSASREITLDEQIASPDGSRSIFDDIDE